jgi:hypothetical protein
MAPGIVTANRYAELVTAVSPGLAGMIAVKQALLGALADSGSRTTDDLPRCAEASADVSGDNRQPPRHRDTCGPRRSVPRSRSDGCTDLTPLWSRLPTPSAAVQLVAITPNAASATRWVTARRNLITGTVNTMT